MLSTQNLPAHVVSGFGASKLVPRFIGLFTVRERHDSAYTLELPSDMRLHPTFYVGRLKPYVQPSHLVVMTRRRRRAARPQLKKANLFQNLNTDV
ncbi:hypothetical protein PHMEG_00041041 [Phytophthora megakarya]|uniref:Tf2-1-like SH3-like domain-containing protein n=1 Tax=Phytophthora megakarya TaxID=4795 RepID=A0A225UBW8_9STRA|nr:hypothetical protein PHMEG_00041041 [Phytophthora megakarya]